MHDAFYFIWVDDFILQFATLLILITIASFFIYQDFLFNTTYGQKLEIGFLFSLFFLVVILRRNWDVIFSAIILSIFSLFIFIQTVYFRAFGQFGKIVTAFSMRNEAVQTTSSAQEFLKWMDLKFILLPLCFVIAIVYVNKIHTKEYKVFKSVKGYLTLIPLLISMIFISTYYYDIQKSRSTESEFTYYKTDHYIYTVIPTTNAFVDKFGLLAWTIRDFEITLIDPFFSNNKQENKEIETILSSRSKENVISEYSSIFKDKQLFLIEAESLNNFAIDPVLTPNLYRLYSNGMKMRNYNSPLLYGSTSDAELMVNTSLYPTNDGYVTFHKYYDAVFPVTLANTFNAVGYRSIASHNNYGEFYNRNIVLPNMGYIFYDCIDMGFETQMIGDAEFLETLTWIMVEKEKLLSFWISFDAHQPYSIEDLKEEMLPYLDEVQKAYPDLPLNEQVYLAKNMDLDRGIGYLLEVYTYSNRIDDLVIMIYGDHQPKGAFLNPEEYTTYCDAKAMDLETCLNTPFIIWNNDAFVGENNTVSNPTDIPITIYDLFGLDYDHQKVLGHSVFDPNYQGFYFDANGTVKTNDFTYNSLTDVIELNNTSLVMDEANLKALEYQNEVTILRKIIENDYFSTLIP